MPPPTPWMTRPSDEHAERRRERADRAADRERDQHHGQHPAAAEEVAELADDRRRDRRREQVAGEDPRGRGRRRRRTRAGSPAARGRRPSARAQTPSPPAGGRGRRPGCDPRVSTRGRSLDRPNRTGRSEPPDCRGVVRRAFDVAQRHVADEDASPSRSSASLTRYAIDLHAVEAAVVEDHGALTALGHQRVPARHRCIVEHDVRRRDCARCAWVAASRNSRMSSPSSMAR